MAIKMLGKKADRSAKVLEIADRVHKAGTVYERLSEQEITRKRSFSSLSSNKTRGRRSLPTVDMNRTYGF